MQYFRMQPEMDPIYGCRAIPPMISAIFLSIDVSKNRPRPAFDVLRVESLYIEDVWKCYSKMTFTV